MKHTRIIPDCPKCGCELQGRYTMSEPTKRHPFGSKTDGWWFCTKCDYESEHFDHNPYDDVKEVVE